MFKSNVKNIRMIDDSSSEYYTEDTEHFAEQASFQRQALEIKEPDGNFDPDTEPQNGEEFLTRMLYERRNIPAVVVKDLKQNELTRNGSRTLKTPKEAMLHETVMQNEEECASYGLEFTKNTDILPTPEWKRVQVTDFLGVRNNIDTMRNTLAEHFYKTDAELPVEEDADVWRRFCCDHAPLLSIMLRFSEPQLEFLLDLISEWLQQYEEEEGLHSTLPEHMDSQSDSIAHGGLVKTPPNSLELRDGATASEVSSQSDTLTKSATATNTMDLSNNWLGSWLYAVLACLHLPLEPATHSKLREIARICVRQRARLQLPQQDSLIPPYNLFIYLIAKVFGQLDFASYV